MRFFRQTVMPTLMMSLLSASTACYDYRPTTGTTTDSGNAVRVSLTDRGSVELAPLIGPQVMKLDGTLVSVEYTALVMRVSSVINRVGYSSSWSGEQLRVPRSDVAAIERRSLNKKKSWIVGSGSLAAVALASLSFNLIGGGGKGGPGGGGGGPR